MIACTAQKEKVELIVHNANVYSVNSDFSIAESFAVRDGKIIEIGSNAQIMDHFTGELLDVEGKSVYPGFIDAHCHFLGYGLNELERAQLVGTKSFEEIIEILKDYNKKYDPVWVLGRGWDQNDWEIKEFPDKKLLDEVFPDKPVFLTRIDGHAGIANSFALQLAGITSNVEVDGGDILISNNEPSGILLDNAMGLVVNIIPPSSQKILEKALLKAEEDCFALGLTSVVDAGLDYDAVVLIDEMQQSGKLQMRINAMLSPSSENFEKFVKQGIISRDRLTIRSIKLYADGALGSRGAKLIEPYSDDPHNNGLLIHQPEYFNEVCKLAFENNYQVNTHAIGDSANRMILNTYAEYLGGKNDLRWRIEHAQVVEPADFHYFEDYSIIPSVQPTHATSDMYWAGDRLGPVRIKNAYALKKLLQTNQWIPLGTDFPVEKINPIYTFYAAVARKDLNQWPKDGFQTENALSREEALKGMTTWAAKGSFEEGQKGSLEKGKFADFIILDKDIMTIPENEIPAVKVLATYSNGIKVYSPK
jgi:hypothetical protein